MLELLDKLDDIAKCAAGPTAIALPPRIDVERRPRIVVKRTEPFERRADRAQIEVTADDIDDVVGFLDALGQGYPIFPQRAPQGSVRSDDRKKCRATDHGSLSAAWAIFSIGTRHTPRVGPIHGSGTRFHGRPCPAGKVDVNCRIAQLVVSPSRIVVRAAKTVKRGKSDGVTG